MTIDFATIGEITVDDTVLETNEIKRAQTGGGSIYSALGIRLWGHKVGVNSVIGHDYLEENLNTLEENRIVTSGIKRIDGWSLRLWLLHEENNKKQQFPKLQSSSFQELDEARDSPPDDYFTAEGFHIATGTPEGQMKSRDIIRSRRPDVPISLDILTESFITWEYYRDGSALEGIDIFSPSVVEIEALWPGLSIDDAIDRIVGFGVRWVAIKMDVRGSVVFDAETGEKHKIPIYPAATVDATGAGDSFSGGFLEGIVKTGNVFEAGLRGTISASFAVEGWGAFHMMNIEVEQAQERYEWLQNKVKNNQS
jgi:ribokinase